MRQLPDWLIDSKAAKNFSAYQPPPRVIEGQKLTGYQRAKYAKLLAKIKQELLIEIMQTEKVVKLDGSLRVSLFGKLHYIREADGSYHVMSGDIHEWAISEDSSRVLIYPPAALTDGLVSILIMRWEKPINEYIDGLERYYSYLNRARPFALYIENQLKKAIKRFLAKSIHWANFRLKLAEMLQLDDEVLQLALRSRTSIYQRSMTVAHYNLVLKHLEVYREANRQLPNLLWLITYSLKLRVKLESGNVLAQCREFMLQEGIGKSGWRLLCNSRISELGYTPHTKNFLSELAQYIRLHQMLGRRSFMSANLCYLFHHPEWAVTFDSVYYRGIHFPPQLMNKYINEIARLQKSGLRADKIAEQTAPVLAWLCTAKPKIDHVQLKKPWSWFLAKANNFYELSNKIRRLRSYCWTPVVRFKSIGNFRFLEVVDAYQLMSLASSQRHCIDSYVNDCKSGAALVFDIYNANGKREAAMLLQLNRTQWAIYDIRGFANKAASSELWGVAHNFTDWLNSGNCEGQISRQISRQR